MEDYIKALIGILVLGAWVINLIKLFSTALADQVGLAIIHAVGLLGPMAIITAWF
jgi:hypothetical protein